MTYAVVVSEDGGPGSRGRLELDAHDIVFSSGERLALADLRDVYLERCPSSPPVLVMISTQGEHFRVSSLEGIGALHELAEAVVAARDGVTT